MPPCRHADYADAADGAMRAPIFRRLFTRRGYTRHWRLTLRYATLIIATLLPQLRDAADAYAIAVSARQRQPMSWRLDMTCGL